MVRKYKSVQNSYLSHSNVVKTIRTVKHNTLHSNRLRQILCGFCFSCSGWALWGPIEVEVECADEGPVAPVGEGGDDEAGGVAQVLVAVVDGGVGDAHQHLALLPVVAQLRQPLEVILLRHTCKIKKKPKTLLL